MMWEASESCLKADLPNLRAALQLEQTAESMQQVQIRLLAASTWPDEVTMQNSNTSFSPKCSFQITLALWHSLSQSKLGSDKEVETSVSCSALAPASQHLQKDLGKQLRGIPLQLCCPDLTALACYWHRCFPWQGGFQVKEAFVGCTQAIPFKWQLKTCLLEVLQFNLRQQLSTMQPPIHSPSMSQYDEDKNRGKNIKLMG